MMARMTRQRNDCPLTSFSLCLSRRLFVLNEFKECAANDWNEKKEEKEIYGAVTSWEKATLCSSDSTHNTLTDKRQWESRVTVCDWLTVCDVSTEREEGNLMPHFTPSSLFRWSYIHTVSICSVTDTSFANMISNQRPFPWSWCSVSQWIAHRLSNCVRPTPSHGRRICIFAAGCLNLCFVLLPLSPSLCVSVSLCMFCTNILRRWMCECDLLTGREKR